MIRKNKAQAALEFVITFVLMVILLFSLLSLWKRWCDKIIDRQRDYSHNRVESGSYSTGLGPPVPWMPD